MNTCLFKGSFWIFPEERLCFYLKFLLLRMIWRPDENSKDMFVVKNKDRCANNYI